MWQTLNKLLDLLFPPRDSQLIMRQNLHNKISSQPGCHEGIFYCANYTHPVVHAAIRENKFYNNGHAQKILAQLLLTWTAEKQLQKVLVVPIPLGPERQRSRGHNQVVSILKHTPHSIKPILKRITETAPQASLGKQQRLSNIKGIFQCDPELLASLSDSTLILLDDVVTTGATLNEARATLAPHLPPDTKLICLALAH